MLLVCSKSTRRFFPDIEDVKIISGRLGLDILREESSHEDVLAVGGGTVIDAAKILSKNPITCYPTTAAGSSCTEHSVVWDGTQKISVKCHIPDKVIVEPEFFQSVSKKVLFETRVDMISHCFDSLFSKRSCKKSENFILSALEILEHRDVTNEELIIAGNLAGKAIQITPTTILHSLSYPLTGRYDISHGRALSYFLPQFSDYKSFGFEKYISDDFEHAPSSIDMDACLSESLSYGKIHDFQSENELKLQFLKDFLCL